MLLKTLGEDSLIESLKKFSGSHRRLLKGIGDDTSVSVQKDGSSLLVTTDILIEDVHFRTKSAPAYLLGRKALSVSLSDIAAMGGTPLFFLVSLALSPLTPGKFIDELYKGLDSVGRETGCVLGGGNVAKTPGPMMVSTTVIGEAPADEVVYRKGARQGDLIFITGTVGGSALGLKALSSRGKTPLSRLPWKKSVKSHLDPAPRLEAGRMLARARLATAMMDISDGVGLDLKRMCIESRKSAVIYLSSLPISDELKAYGRKTGKSPMVDFALTGGEDYELIFTSPEKNLRKISALSRKLNLPMTPVGKIMSQKKHERVITVLDEDGEPMELKKLGFEHY
ncbi:MAG: thiamine-phosphate kinase [Deltaproteobacteria bacterium]|nr:thiamine-phosphate kinase [Deltaproteobacteria bacterium]